MRRVRAVDAVAVTCLASFLLLLVVHGARFGNVNNGDTNLLVAGARVAVGCVGDGVWTDCGLVADRQSSAVQPFPLFQYVPAGLLVALGMDDATIVAALARFNAVALVASVVLGLGLARRRVYGWGRLLVAAVLSGPLLFYATAAFGEMVVTFACLTALAAVTLKRPVLAGVLIAVAATGKETLGPFLVGLGVLAVLGTGGWRRERRLLVAIVVGGVVGAVAGAAFNLFRFGTPRNIVYLSPQFVVPGFRQRGEFFAALWVGPGGGLLWFWPLVTGCLCAFAVVALVIAVRDRDHRRPALAIVGVVGVVAVYHVGLAIWAYPYGWIAWGPRLSLPLLPAATAVVVHLLPDSVRSANARFLRPMPVRLAAGAGLAIAALPHVGAVWNYQGHIAALLSPAATCPPLTNLGIDFPGFYQCMDRYIWRIRPSFLLAGVHPPNRVGQLAELLLVVGLVALVVGWTPRASASCASASEPDSDGLGRSLSED